MSSRALLRSALLLAAALVSAIPSPAQWSFVDVAETSGFDSAAYTVPGRGFGAGAAAADFDGDGEVDLFVPTRDGIPHQLYRNLGTGLFEEVADPLGLASLDSARVALWLDYDADGLLDLLLASDCYQVDCTDLGSSLRLFRQTEAGSFVDVTVQAGLSDTVHDTEEHRSGMAAGDVNGDGYLDFVAGFWEGALHLYVNQGDGTFADLSTTSGLDDAVLGYHQPVMQDLNGDGLLDIYAAIDFTENRMWLNQGTVAGVPSFLEAAELAGGANAMNDMGVALGDFDDDGDPDLYITNIFRDGRHNVLLRNDTASSVAAFADIAEASNVDDGAWGWGATFLDIENDGDLDLAETNGWNTNTWTFPPRLFVNEGGGSSPSFVDRALEAGLTDMSWGSALLAFDYDLDGDLDLFETIAELDQNDRNSALRLHQNQLDNATLSHHFLLVRPRMTGPNHRAIGARVAAETASTTRYRWIGAGSSYLGQEPAEAFFGLGIDTVVVRLIVLWPDGEQTIRGDVPVDQVLTVSSEGIFSSGFESGTTASWSFSSP